MQELQESQLLQMISENDVHFVLFIYTPFCGTCKIARSMLEVIQQTYPSINLYQANIQYLPSVCERLQISSVPCLVRVGRGQSKNNLYAFHSVTFLLEHLQPWII